MATLEDFAAQCKTMLKAKPGNDEAFVGKHLGDDTGAQGAVRGP